MIKAHEDVTDLRLPRIGVIRKGAPKPDRGPGKDLDYFRLTRADESVITAWNEVLGREPKAISGILPYADPAANLDIWDELWQGKRLLWRGDGDRLHVQLQGNSYVRYSPGNGPAQPAAAGEMVNKLKVARVSRLRLLLPQLRIAGIFEVDSSSAIDADELWANLMWIKATVPTLQGAPVTLFRAARQFNVPQDDGNTMVVTKHMLHLMLDGRYLDALLPSPAAALLAPVQPPPALALAAGNDDEDDAPEEGDYEDAPPAPTTAKPAAQTATVEPVTSAADFVARANRTSAVKAVGFTIGRLRDWVDYVTGNNYDPARAGFLAEVLDRYCSAVADNGTTHTKAAAEKAKTDYEAGLAALAEATEPPAAHDEPLFPLPVVDPA